MMQRVPQPGLTLPAVADRLERGVRQHSASTRWGQSMCPPFAPALPPSTCACGLKGGVLEAELPRRTGRRLSQLHRVTGHLPEHVRRKLLPPKRCDLRSRRFPHTAHHQRHQELDLAQRIRQILPKFRGQQHRTEAILVRWIRRDNPTTGFLCPERAEAPARGCVQ
jgi:hypothetical protein